MQVPCWCVFDKLVRLEGTDHRPVQQATLDVAHAKQISLGPPVLWIVLALCALFVSLDFWSSWIHYSSGNVGVHWVPSHYDHVHSSKKMIHGISQAQSLFYWDYVVAAKLQ